VVNIQVKVFWVVTPCSCVSGYQQQFNKSYALVRYWEW